MRVLFAAVTLALAAGLGLDGGAGSGGNFSLEQARAFAEHPLVWAGEEVAGLPLTAVLRRDDTARYVSFVYGDCAPSADSGCAPPVEIQVWPANARGLGSYGAAAAGAPVPAPEPTRARGVPAAFVGDSQLELYARRATVVVFTHSRERSLEVATALRCLSGARPRDGPLEC